MEMQLLNHPQGDIAIVYSDLSSNIVIHNFKYDSEYAKNINSARIWVSGNRYISMKQLVYECIHGKLINWTNVHISENWFREHKELRLSTEIKPFCDHPIVNAYANWFDSIGFILSDIRSKSFRIDDYFLYFGSVVIPQRVIEIKLLANPEIDHAFGVFKDGSFAYVGETITKTSKHTREPRIKIELKMETVSVHIPDIRYDEHLKIGIHNDEFIDLNDELCYIDGRYHLSAYILNSSLALVHTKSFFKIDGSSWKTKFVYEPKSCSIIFNEMSFEYDKCEFISIMTWNEHWDTRTAEFEHKLETVVEFYKRLNAQNKERVLSGADVEDLLITEEHAIDDMYSILSQINASNFNTGLHQNVLRLSVIDEKDKRFSDVSEREIIINISYASDENYRGDKRLVLIRIPVSGCDIRKRLNAFYRELKFISDCKATWIRLPSNKVEELLDQTIAYLNSIGIQSNKQVAKNLDAIHLFQEFIKRKQERK